MSCLDISLKHLLNIILKLNSKPTLALMLKVMLMFKLILKLLFKSCFKALFNIHSTFLSNLNSKLSLKIFELKNVLITTTCDVFNSCFRMF